MDEDGYGYGMNRVALDPVHERRVAARREDLRGLAAHVGTYLLVCSGLLIANLLTSPAYLWALWPAFGWGIGVAAHAAGVLGRGGAHGPCQRYNQARLSPRGPWRGDAAPFGTGWRQSEPSRGWARPIQTPGVAAWALRRTMRRAVAMGRDTQAHRPLPMTTRRSTCTRHWR